MMDWAAWPRFRRRSRLNPMPIQSEKEFEEKLEQLGRLYRAVRVQFANVTITQESAKKLILGTGKIVDTITAVLSDIEEYTGAAEIRRLAEGLKQVRREREGEKF